MRYRNYSYLC